MWSGSLGFSWYTDCTENAIEQFGIVAQHVPFVLMLDHHGTSQGCAVESHEANFTTVVTVEHGAFGAPGDDNHAVCCHGEVVADGQVAVVDGV